MNNDMEWNVDTDPGFDEFAGYLSNTLTPVEPRVEFVRDLHQKLLSMKTTRNRRNKFLKFGVFGTAGILSSLILLATSVKAVVTLLGAVRVMRQDVTLQKEQVAPLNPTG